MSQKQQTTAPVPRWVSEDVFLMLKDPFRRRIIRSLALAGMKSALEVNAGSGMKRHTSLKHLTVMCKARILVKKRNPKDARQPLYALSPAAIVSNNKDFLIVDFGCCMLRFAK